MAGLFRKKEGPLAYKLSSRWPKMQITDPNPVRALSVEDWLKCTHKDHKPTLKEHPEAFHLQMVLTVGTETIKARFPCQLTHQLPLLEKNNI